MSDKPTYKELEKKVRELENAAAEHEQIEQALKESEARYRLLADNVTDVIWVMDGNLEFTYYSPSIQRLSGITPQEAMKQTSADQLTPASLEFASKTSEEYMKVFLESPSDSLEPLMMELEGIRKDGSTGWSEVNMTFLLSPERTFAGIVGVSRDITKRKRAEEELAGYRDQLEDLVAERTEDLNRTNEELQQEISERKEVEKALRESEKRFRVLIEHASDSFFLLTMDGEIVDVNQQACSSLGYTRGEFLSMSMGDVEVEIESNEQKERFWDNLPSHQPVTFEGIYRRKDGTTFPVEVRLGLLEIGGQELMLGLARDIADRKQREGELLKTQKLESVGVLAGGIAHDFNNFLTSIWGNIHLAKMDTIHGGELFERLEQAEKGCQRAKDLAQQLLTFSKGGAPIKKPTSVSKMIRDAAALSLSGSSIKCDMTIPDDLWPAEVDEGQMNQVLNNLFLNAVQSMPEGGILQICGKNIPLSVSAELPSKQGDYIRLSIQDHGIGIKKENLSKIFDPYFTTKQKGSGLGLGVVYSIIKKHDGYITVESDPGMGTTFHVYLPACEAESEKEDQSLEDFSLGEGRILVMDDEEMVRNLVGKFLTHLGYDVEFASDGVEAVDLYRCAMETGRSFDAVILDLTVPGGMGGKKAVKHLLEVDPEIKAIVSSGYSNDPVMADCEKYGFLAVIPKPYKLGPLSTTLKKVITMAR